MNASTLKAASQAMNKYQPPAKSAKNTGAARQLQETAHACGIKFGQAW